MSIRHFDGACREAGVAEQGRMAPGIARRGAHRRFLARLAASTALASTTLLAAASAAQAGSPVAVPANMLPQGGHFVAGSGSIGTQGLTETITQSSQRGIIDFNSFSIGKSGTVKINNGAGATLDRVTGGSLSQIMGTLAATGSVTLVNATGTITPAPLTITANNEMQVLGTPEPQFSASFGTFPGGLGPSALDGMLSFTTNAPTGSPGSFKIFAGGVSSSNFDITFVPGTLLVTAANNSLPPVPFSMDQGDTTPAFSFTDPVLASLLLQVSDTSGSGGSAMKKNSSAPTLDENGNPLGNLISFNSSFLEVCRTRATLCR